MKKAKEPRRVHNVQTPEEVHQGFLHGSNLLGVKIVELLAREGRGVAVAQVQHSQHLETPHFGAPHRDEQTLGGR